MQVLFQSSCQSNSINEEFLAYVYSVIGIIKENHFNIYVDNNSVLKVLDSGILKLFVPHTQFECMSRSKLYRLLTAGLCYIFQSIHSFSDSFNHDTDYVLTDDYEFDIRLKNPIFLKNSSKDWAKSVDFDDKYNEDYILEDWLFRIFSLQFSGITPYINCFESI